MTIVNFTPGSGLAGGLLIGLSAVLMLWLGGRIAGISGILGNAMTDAGKHDRLWRWAFLAGLVISGLAWRQWAPDGFSLQAAPALPLAVIAGLLVGVGTRMGNGCTSGHGVCGLALFSTRSIVATLTFMAAGFITVFVLRHLV
jgi:uncharacterized membrane protein YedE/YeeE